jgi:WD40 repeat protein
LSTETPATIAAFSPDSQLVATGAAAAIESLKLWDVATGAPRPSVKGHGGWPTGLAFSTDARTLATTSSDGAVTLWDATTGVQRLPAPGPRDWYGSVRFSPDGETMALAFGPKVDLVDSASAKRRARLADHRDIITGLDFAPDSQTLATGSREATIKFWDIASGQLQTTARPGDRVWNVRYLPDGKTLVSMSFAHLQFWDPASGLVRTSWPAPRKDNFAHVILSADCKLLVATMDNSNLVRLWDVETAKERPPIAPFPGHSYSPMLTADGKLLAIRLPYRHLQPGRSQLPGRVRRRRPAACLGYRHRADAHATGRTRHRRHCAGLLAGWPAGGLGEPGWASHRLGPRRAQAPSARLAAARSGPADRLYPR